MRRAITVRELLVLLIFLAAVVALLIPKIANVQRAATRMKCHDLGSWMQGGPSTVRVIEEPESARITGEGLPFGGTHFRNTRFYRAPHAVAFHVLMADGSIREIQDFINPQHVLPGLATIAGGEEILPAW